jgi:hypothetical protein
MMEVWRYESEDGMLEIAEYEIMDCNGWVLNVGDK